MLYPFLYDSIFANGLTRAGATIFNQGLGFFELLKNLFTNFLSYFSLNYLRNQFLSFSSDNQILIFYTDLRS